MRCLRCALDYASGVRYCERCGRALSRTLDDPADDASGFSIGRDTSFVYTTSSPPGTGQLEPDAVRTRDYAGALPEASTMTLAQPEHAAQAEDTTASARLRVGQWPDLPDGSPDEATAAARQWPDHPGGQPDEATTAGTQEQWPDHPYGPSDETAAESSHVWAGRQPDDLGGPSDEAAAATAWWPDHQGDQADGAAATSSPWSGHTEGQEYPLADLVGDLPHAVGSRDEATTAGTQEQWPDHPSGQPDEVTAAARQWPDHPGGQPDEVTAAARQWPDHPGGQPDVPVMDEDATGRAHPLETLPRARAALPGSVRIAPPMSAPAESIVQAPGRTQDADHLLGLADDALDSMSSRSRGKPLTIGLDDDAPPSRRRAFSLPQAPRGSGRPLLRLPLLKVVLIVALVAALGVGVYTRYAAYTRDLQSARQLASHQQFDAALARYQRAIGEWPLHSAATQEQGQIAATATAVSAQATAVIVQQQVAATVVAERSSVYATWQHTRQQAAQQAVATPQAP